MQKGPLDISYNTAYTRERILFTNVFYVWISSLDF